MKKLLLPTLLVTMGLGAAFATNKAKNSPDATVQGYVQHPISGLCVDAKKQCSDNSTNPICTWSEDPTVQLQREGATFCSDPLYELN
ncbi:DUF6520 family protein [Chryseobacterium sp. c4a]|uniref:DUF6520 family protein n=1 Tax=Chryseobacterium sp. c4a TaxID=1573582 RepID=UPI001357BE5E|nr:DUF6520 family protein [Chryseobacterium sp. c4a]